MRTTTRAAAGIAGVLAVTMTLSGCASLFLPPAPSKTSVPTGESVSADLQPFYGQALKWSSCEENDMQCATAKAPLNWSNPTGGTIELSLIRHLATGTRLGSLLVNPGGPGGSGYDFVKDKKSLDFAVDSKLQASYDIVGFDPRGVSRSTPVSCYKDPKELDAYLYGIAPGTPGTDAWLDSSSASNRAFGARCLELSGPLLGKVDTLSAARDMDMTRAILGDKKLNYLGYSYGSLLGQVYADLFPDKTGRLVLDGVVDPAASDFEETAAQAVGFESALKAFLVDCHTASDCPFTGTTDQATTQIRAFLDSLDASPIANSDGRQLGSATMFTAIILPLYSKDSWKYLRQLFTAVFTGDPRFAFELADSYNGRAADGTYASNEIEAFISISCLDSWTAETNDQMRADAVKLTALAPVFGNNMAYGAAGCPNWPVPPVRERGPIVAAGSAPILVVGTTNDPATPYKWAVTVSQTLQNGHLVTYTGEGHTAYNKSNACVNTAVDNFLVNGTVPATDPKC